MKVEVIFGLGVSMSVGRQLKVSFRLLMVAAACGVGAEALSEPLAYKVSDVYLSGLLSENGELSLAVPKFYIFNSDGRLLAHIAGLSDDFEQELEKGILQNSRPGVMASELFATMTDYNDQPVTFSAAEYDYIFVEYWAEWCSPCLKQMEMVKNFIAETEEKKILWVKVEQDPAKLAIVRSTQVK